MECLFVVRNIKMEYKFTLKKNKYGKDNIFMVKNKDFSKFLPLNIITSETLIMDIFKAKDL